MDREHVAGAAGTTVEQATPRASTPSRWSRISLVNPDGSALDVCGVLDLEDGTAVLALPIYLRDHGGEWQRAPFADELGFDDRVLAVAKDFAARAAADLEKSS